MTDFDIAIIGAGPGGCTCALALKESGLRVLLVDKDKFPRDKICGDAIPGPAFKVLSKIDPELGIKMKRFAENSIIRSSKGFAPNGKSITFDWKTFSYNSKRLNFDNFLLNLVRTETETTILESKRLNHVESQTDRIDCHFQDNYSLSAGIVIACDGANSIVARELAQYNLQSKPPSTAVRAYYKDVQGVKEGINEFHFFNELPLGYFWIFPLGNGWTNVGLGVLKNKKDGRSSKQNLRKTLETVVSSFPSIAPRFKNAQLKQNIKGFALPLCTQERKLSGDRFMLCGDAASLISPLWGHGIDTAMSSGFYAAKQAESCFKKLDFSADHIYQYDVVINKKITKAFTKSAKILRLLNRFPFLLNSFWSLMKFKKLFTWVTKIPKLMSG